MNSIVNLTCLVLLAIASVKCWVRSRSDAVGTISPDVNTDLGNYGINIYCDPGSYAAGFALRTHHGGPDNTAVNRVRLTCE